MRAKTKRKILLPLFVISALSTVYLVCFFASFLIQIPASRSDVILYIGLTFSGILATFSILGVKRMTRTKFSRESCFFVFLVVTMSLLIFIWGNLILKLKISVQYTITISVLVSTPLSCAIAGYSKKNLSKSLKKLGLNKGVTLVAFFALALIPVIEYPTVIYSFTQTGYVLPNLMFRNTENTSYINGIINSSGFFAEIRIHENQTFEAKNMVQLIIPSLGNRTVDLCFHITSFSGNYKLIESLEMLF